MTAESRLSRPAACALLASKTGLLTLTVLASSSWSSALAQLPPPPQARHATYDFTEGPADPNLGLAEVWVDTKSPGNGFTYSVGTIEVTRTIAGKANPNPVLFSGAPIQPATGLMGFEVAATGTKQIVVVQAVNDAQAIIWQRYFYGFAEDGNRYANARGISVWVGPDAESTRIAICGESTHDNLPLDQGAAPFPTARNKGFIAVFDGTGDHLWSHQLYGIDAQGNPVGEIGMAVTDVAMRVAAGRDIVTFCGFADIGAGNLGPDAAFPSDAFVVVPPGGCPGDNPAIGTTDNGAGNIDGFVGRISNGAGGRNIDFHSIVGGNVMDGLFGIAELDNDRFVVVGTTRLNNETPGTASPFTFPFTDFQCLGAGANFYSLGVVMRFDASQTPGNPLLLDWSQRIGTGPANSTFTSARDVVIQREWDTDQDLAVVVGDTDDPELTQTLFNLPGLIGPQAALGGGTDGYVATVDASPTLPVGIFTHVTYRGGADDEGLSGVQAWNEFVDHFAVVGFDDAQAAGADIDVATYWINTSGLVTATTPDGLVLAREAPLGPSASFQPTALGAASAGLDELQGGGVSVNETGRVTAVGALVDVLTYDATVAPEIPGRPNNNPEEAYRVVLDMLPPLSGRTDGTGNPIAAPGPQYPVAGFFGGTTPECALSPVGNRVDEPAAALNRMLIEYIGPPPGDNQPMTVVVDQPPPVGALVSAWQLDFPGMSGGVGPNPGIIPGGVIGWTTNSPTTYAFANAGRSFAQQWTLPDLPLGQTEVVTVQLVVFFGPGAAIPGGNLGPGPCIGTSEFAASPAMWFSYTGN